MILITGASRGIGKYLFEKYVGGPERVIGLYHKTEPTSHADSYEKVDVTDENQFADFISKRRPELQQIKFIHCAGVNLNGFTHKLAAADWRYVIQGNLESAFLLTKHLLPIMREQNYGRIIFVASVVPQIGVPGTSAYAASKAGLWGLMKVVSKENALKNVTCNTLNLGYYDIGMISEVPKEMMTTVLASVPMKKLGDPVNIYHAMQFITASDYLTGSEINISGGLV
jgi:NAD(P)-dependent dehydrogenase (short-subunit alcohol dehydrogenase family)